MNPEIERNLGEQPIARLMREHNLKPHDLVANSAVPMTHKMVARACKRRRLTLNTQSKVLAALNRANGKNYSRYVLFHNSSWFPFLMFQEVHRRNFKDFLSLVNSLLAWYVGIGSLNFRLRRSGKMPQKDHTAADSIRDDSPSRHCFAWVIAIHDQSVSMSHTDIRVLPCPSAPR